MKNIIINLQITNNLKNIANRYILFEYNINESTMLIGNGNCSNYNQLWEIGLIYV